MSRRTLSKKAKGFAKDYALTENGTLAARKNYAVKNDHTAAVIASENLTKPDIVAEIEKVQKSLAERIPNELLHKVMIEGLEANRVISANITYGDADEKTNDFIEVPDHAVRHKFLDTAHKLKGTYAPEKAINLNVDIETAPEIKELTKKLNEVYRDGV